MKIKRNNILHALLLTFWICLIVACTSLKSGKNKKMTDEQYFAYLRMDTSFCELPELKVNESFYDILDTIILTKHKFISCDTDSNPYVYSIEVKLQDNCMVYIIETLYSTQNLDHFYKGAFRYKGEIFVVSDTSLKEADFSLESNPVQVKIPFCDRIYHPKFKFVSIIRNGEVQFECVKNDIIMIK
jgi:hypothetical protein